MVVDERNAGHCICLYVRYRRSSVILYLAKLRTRPILTYGGQATTKKGVHGRDHAVIFTGKSSSIFKGEKLSKKAIRMIPDSSRHHLDPASRINYAKVYTVEHNVKVYFIGKISQKHEQQVTTDYNDTHRPLPDRPFSGDMTDEEFGHAEGTDPNYPARQMSQATSSWAPSGAAQTQGFNTVQTSTTVASSYKAPMNSDWSTATTAQPSSLYMALPAYTAESASTENYSAPYHSTSTYGAPSTTIEPQPQAYTATSTYPQHSEEGAAAGVVSDETDPVATQYDPLYDASE